ncbi:hypothetical protein [Pseudaminobacter sp. NGMCC 1.201702]
MWEVRFFAEANDGSYYVWFKSADRSEAETYAREFQRRRQRNLVTVAEAA